MTRTHAQANPAIASPSPLLIPKSTQAKNPPEQEVIDPQTQLHRAQHLSHSFATVSFGAPPLSDQADLENEASEMGERAALGMKAEVRGVGAGIQMMTEEEYDYLLEGRTEEEVIGACEAAGYDGYEDADYDEVLKALAGSGRKKNKKEKEDDDREFIVPEPREKSKKSDPKAKIKGNPARSIDPKTKIETMEYETEGGAKHKETFDPDKLFKTTVTSDAQFRPEFRNNAKRPKQGFAVHNHFGLSKGQQSRNQLVGAHQTPSWLGMKAGGEHENMDMTSPSFNSETEVKEKEWRSDQDFLNPDDQYSYQTETESELIAKDPRVKEIVAAIANHPKNSKKRKTPWDEKRVENRLKKVTALHPKTTRVKSQRRTITNQKSKKSKTFKQGTDLLAMIPARAYDMEAQEKYEKARGEESEGSDSELMPTKKKKTKPNT